MEPTPVHQYRVHYSYTTRSKQPITHAMVVYGRDIDHAHEVASVMLFDKSHRYQWENYTTHPEQTEKVNW